MPRNNCRNSILIGFISLLSLGGLVTAGPAAPTAACSCKDLEVLQVELRNAQRLQQAFRNKIPDLRSMTPASSMAELQRFARTDARRDLESLPNYKGAGEFDYVAQGSLLYDPTHPTSTDNNQLCSLTASAQADFQQAMKSSACDGIGKALQAHEEVHRNSCLAKGFVNFFEMNGADRAQEEVDAYGAQIKALRGEIAQVLERAQFTVILAVKTRAQMPANPLYSAITIENHSEIQTSSASGSADKFRFDGQGQQTNNVSVDGNCRMTGGVPFNLPARVSIETDGLTAEVSYETQGTMPSIGMSCEVAGGHGYGMSMPVPMNAGKVPVTKMPLKDGAEMVFDMSQSEAAQIMARGRVQLTGTATVRLVCKN